MIQRHLLPLQIIPLLLSLLLAGGFTPAVMAIDDLEWDKLMEMSILDLTQYKITVASRTEETLAQAPSTVSLFTREDINNMGIKTLEELLNFVPGFQSARSEENGTLTNAVAIRGRRTDYSSPDILISIDGQPLNDTWTGGALKINNNLSLSSVQQIEVIRGPGSALYGANAFLGVINIITLKDKNEAYIGAGNLNFREGYFNLSKTHNNYTLALTGHSFADDGDKYSTPAFGGLPFESIEDTQDPLSGLDLSLGLYGARLQLNLRHVSRNQQDFIQFGGISNDSNAAYEQAISYTGKFNIINQENTQLSLSAGWYEAETINTDMVLPAGWGATFGILEADDQRALVGGELIDQHQYNINLDSIFTFSDKHSLLAGLGYKQEFIDRALFQGNTDAEGILFAETPVFSRDFIAPSGRIMASDGGLSLDKNKLIDKADREIISAYTQYKTTLLYTDNLSLQLTAGLRYDNYSDFGSNLSPRVATVMTLPKTLSTIKLMYGEAFRAPSFREQFQYNLVYVGNADLNPEIVRTLELGYLQEINHIQTSLTYYISKIENGVTLEPGDQRFADQGRNFNSPQNTDSVDLSGFEAEITSSIDTYVGNFQIKAAATLQNEAKEEPRNHADTTYSVAINYAVSDFNFNLNFYHHSKVEARAILGSNNYTELDAFDVVNFNARWQFMPETTLQFRVNNLLDESYDTYTSTDTVTSGGIPNRGISYSLGIEIQL